MQSTSSVRIAFLPTFRFHYSDWCGRMHRENRAALAATPGVEVIDVPAGDGPGTVPNGAVHTLDEAEVAAKWFCDQRIDGIVICPLDFGDERSVASVAATCDVPVLLYATDEPPAQTDASLSRVSDSYCGTLSIATALHRRKVTFHFAGIHMPYAPELAAAFAEFASAVAVVSGMRGARLGQVGVRPASFETVAYDERALVTKFGQNVICRNIDDIVAMARDIASDDKDLRERMNAMRGEVSASSAPESYYEPAARIELALARFWKQERLSAMTMQCWPTMGRAMGIEMCASFGRLTGQGMLTACETDMLGALSMLMQHRACRGDTIPHFIDWTIRHREDKNTFLAWHCGNAPVRLARDPSKTALRTRANMTGNGPTEGRGGLFQFELKPGKVTLCRLAEYDGAFKLLITHGEIMPTGETLAGTWAWVKVADHDLLYRTLVEQGFIHHASMAHGDQSAALLMACRFLGIQTVVV
jgi:L-fucose isomerase-like protein